MGHGEEKWPKLPLALSKYPLWWAAQILEIENFRRGDLRYNLKSGKSWISADLGATESDL